MFGYFLPFFLDFDVGCYRYVEDSKKLLGKGETRK